MRRKKTPLVLLSIFVLAPVLLIAVLGMLAIRAFESTSATFRLNGLVEQLLANVADEVDATFASDPSRLPGFLPIASPETLAVNLEPAAEFLARPELLACETATQAGDLPGALDVLEPLFGDDVPPAPRAAAFLAAGDVLQAGGHRAAADAIRARASRLEPGQLDDAIRRWLAGRLVAADAPEPIDARAIDEWCDQLGWRPVDVEELVLIEDLARRSREHPRLVERVRSRIDAPRRAALVARAVAALDPPRASMVCLEGHRFAVSADRRSAVDLGPAPDHFSSTPPSSGGNGSGSVRMVEGIRRTARVSVDFGDSPQRVVSELPRLSVRLVPRALLLVACLAYGAIAVVLLVSVARHQRRSEALIAAREDLIARVTHELRTPLTVLRMYGESLAAGRVPADAREDYVRTMAVESERLGQIVDRVAAAARGEAAEPIASATDASAAIDAAIARARPVVAERGGAIDRRGASDAAPVAASTDDLRLILDVLIDNAAKYGGDPPRLEVALDRADGVVRVGIRDHGPGVAPAERARLFERWFRGAEGVKSRQGGAGMGLFLARRAARAAGGDLVLEFPDDGGTRAVLTLPAAERPS